MRHNKTDVHAHAGRGRGRRRVRRPGVGAAAAGQDRPARDAGGPVRRRRCGRHARRRDGGAGAQRRGGREKDRGHQGVVGREARRGGERDAQARRAGQGRHHGRPAVRLGRHRGQGLLQDPAEHHLHQRLLGRAGDHARQPVDELLPLQHRGRAVDGGPRQGRARQGLQAGDGDRRGLRLPLLAGAGLHDRVLQARRQGAGQGLGAARRQGLRLGDRPHPEGRGRAGGGARRRRRGELPQPVRAGGRRQAAGRRLDHGEPGHPELQGQAARFARGHDRRSTGRGSLRRRGLEEVRRRVPEGLSGQGRRLPEPVALRVRLLREHEGGAPGARGRQGRSLRRPEEVSRGAAEDGAEDADRRGAARCQPAGDRHELRHRGREGLQGRALQQGPAEGRQRRSDARDEEGGVQDRVA